MAIRNTRWKEIAELVGVFGVIASLVIVAVEIRSNNDAVRSATVHSISSESVEVVMQLVNNPELRDAYYAALNDKPDDSQKALLDIFSAGLMRLQVNRFEQIKSGFLNEETALRIGGRSRFYLSDYFRDFWTSTKSDYELAFQQYMESKVIGQ
jgi:hypothetical protein